MLSTSNAVSSAPNKARTVSPQLEALVHSGHFITGGVFLVHKVRGLLTLYLAHLQLAIKGIEMAMLDMNKHLNVVMEL